jgi:hypothetical protein
MLERLPFEISSFATMDEVAFALKKTVKGVKAQATREQWGRRAAPDGSILWAIAEMPHGVRHTVIYNLLERDGKNHDFTLFVAEEFSAVAPSFPRLLHDARTNGGWGNVWFEATLWCKRLQIVDDIMLCVPNHDFTGACVSVAYATGIGWREGIERLISFTEPRTDAELPILDTDRCFWLPAIFERLQTKGAQNTKEPKRSSAKVLQFSSKSAPAEAKG